MSIVADRGLFVRLLVQSGKFEPAQAEALVDAIDATTKEPASKAELEVAVTELRGDIKRLEQRIDALERRLDQRIDALDKRLDGIVDRIFVRLGGLMIALVGLLFAALRLT